MSRSVLWQNVHRLVFILRCIVSEPLFLPSSPGGTEWLGQSSEDDGWVVRCPAALGVWWVWLMHGSRPLVGLLCWVSYIRLPLQQEDLRKEVRDYDEVQSIYIKSALESSLFKLDYYLLSWKDRVRPFFHVHRRCPWRRLQTLPIGPAGCAEDGEGTRGDAGCWSFEPVGLLDLKVIGEHCGFGLACAEDWKGHYIWSKCKAKCKAFPNISNRMWPLIEFNPRCSFLLGTELMNLVALRLCSAEVTSLLLHDRRFSWFLILVLRARELQELAASTSCRKDYRANPVAMWPFASLCIDGEVPEGWGEDFWTSDSVPPAALPNGACMQQLGIWGKRFHEVKHGETAVAQDHETLHSAPLLAEFIHLDSFVVFWGWYRAGHQEVEGFGWVPGFYCLPCLIACL